MRVAVLMGGLSTERDISLKSGRAVAEALRARGHDVVPIEVGRDLPAQLVAAAVDAAWIALHGRFGEDGCVQGLLEVMGIPYTNSGVQASAVAMDKIATKRALAHDPRVVLAPDAVVRRGAGGAPEVVVGGAPGSGDLAMLPVPCVVKPSVGGSTIGIRFVQERTELEPALEAALALDPEVLVEAYVEGQEITVAVLDGQPLPVVLIEPDTGFFDFETKYTKGRTTYSCPAPIPAATAEAAQRAAAAAFEVLGCRGVARADFLVPDSGVPVFLEINTIPGFTATSLAPMAAQAAGLSMEELVERVLLGATRMEAEV